MARDDEQARVLRRQRASYLEHGRLVGEHPAVRPEIVASWDRSLQHRVDPGSVHPDFKKLESDQLFAAARPVIEFHLDSLSGTCASILFADSEGRLIGRWAEDRELRSTLSGLNIDPGFSMAETVIGTNGVGTVFETRSAVEIRGPEHFSDRFLDFTCVGAPIRHPITRRIVGAVDITCRYEDTSPLARPWIADLARQIEQRLLEGAAAGERRLLDTYLAASRRSRRPVICLNDHMLISNPAASGILGAFDQQVVWEKVQQACAGSTSGTSTLTLSNGQELTVHCGAVRDGRAMVGAVVEIRPGRAAVDAVRGCAMPSPAAMPPDPTLPGLVGTSARWANVCAQARLSLQGCDDILVVGEAGTGKLALLKAMFDGAATFWVLDCALEPLDGMPAWVGALRDRMRDPTAVIVLTHVESLGVPAARAVSSLLDARPGGGPRIAATQTTGHGAVQFGPLIDRLSVNRIALPALRERSEDVPGLVRELTRRHFGRLEERRWLPEALTELARQRWAGNVRELEATVRQVINLHPAGYFGVAELPEELTRAGGARRSLSRLEALERQEIIETLRVLQGNKVLTAKRLNLARSTLYRKMSALGITNGVTAE